MNIYHIDYGELKKQPPFMGIAIDMANPNPNSICAISLAWINGTQIKGTKYLVKPPTSKFTFSTYHGITAETVADADPFHIVWENHIIPLMNFNIFAAHYCQPAMQALIDSYEFNSDRIFPANKYIVYDTCISSRKIWPTLKDHKLATVAANLGVTIDNKDILSRSMAVANILNYFYKKHSFLAGWPKILAYAANKHCFSQWFNDIDGDETYGLKGDPELS